MQNLIGDIDIMQVIYIVGTVIILVGLKMKWWTKSDFAKARDIVKEGLEVKKEIGDIAKDVALNTKFDVKKALPEVIEIVREEKNKDTGKKDPLKNKVWRGGRKFLWSFLEGGL